MATWYWYFSGMFTILFAQSILLNIGLARGWVKFHKRTKPVVRRIYDQDDSGSYKRVV